VVKKISIDRYEVVLKRIFLPIVIVNFYKNQETKTSEVVATENERKNNIISICFLDS
jgi:hypothetical protein